MQTISKLYEMEKCPRKEKLLFLDKKEGKNYEVSLFLTNLFNEYGLSFTKEQLETLMNDTFKEDFSNLKEEISFKNKLIRNIIMFQNYLLNNNYKVIRKPGVKEMDLNGTKINLKYDLILEKDGEIFVSRVKNSKPILKLRGAKDETAPSKSIELYLLYKLGKERFNNKKVYGTIFYLKNDMDNDKSTEFEYKKGKNIISYSFNEPSDVILVNERLYKILNNNNCGDCNECKYNSLCNPRIINRVEVEENKDIANKELSLTVNQKIATNFDNGVARISATAGSGKSTVLANRFIELIKQGTEPNKIIGLTFTNQGVIELKEKLNYWSKIRNVDCTGIEIKTFNGFSFDLIKGNYKDLGFTDEPQILDRATSLKLIEELLDKNDKVSVLNYEMPFMELFSAKGSVLKCLEFIETLDVGIRLSPNDVSDILNVEEEDAKIILNIFNEYKDILKKENFITMDEQIDYANQLLNTDFVENLGYEHIVVDEAQDTNTPQLNILLKLYKSITTESVAICGDDSQSIYGWRGADANLLIDLQKYIPELFDIKLEENFRSTREICNLANYINNSATNKIDKNMKANRKGEKPTIKHSSINEVAKDIKELIDLGKEPKDIAFIARTKKELLEMESELNKLNVPCNVQFSQLLIENDYFKNIIGLAHFFVDNDDLFSLASYFSMVNTNKFDNIEDYENFIHEQRDNLIKIIKPLSETEKFDCYMGILNNFYKESNAIQIFIDKVKKHNFKEIKEVVNYIDELVKYKSDITIQNNTTDNSNKVTLITIHSSKGKEYENVFINLDGFKGKTNDEEIRTLFVAITRAKTNLNIYYSRNSYLVNLVQSFLLL